VSRDEDHEVHFRELARQILGMNRLAVDRDEFDLSEVDFSFIDGFVFHLCRFFEIVVFQDLPFDVEACGVPI
jgi:hypothetical protein